MSATAPTLPFDDEKPIGHNSAGDPAAIRADFSERVIAFLKGADVWAKRETLDEALAPRAKDFVAGAKKLLKEADAARVVEKKPHADKVKDVDAWWGDLATKVDKIVALTTPKLTAYAKAEQVKKDAAAAEANRIAQEKENARQAALLAAANATSDSERIEAESRADTAARELKVAQREERKAEAPVRIASATGLARAGGMRKEWTALLVEPSRAALHYRNHPEVVDLIKRLALRDLREAPSPGGEKRIPTIPGVTFTSEEKFS